MYYGTYYQSPVGEIFIAGDEENIIGLWIGEQKYITSTMPDGIVEINLAAAVESKETYRSAIHILKEGTEWLGEYFAGKRPEISRLPLAPAGTSFRREVWQILMEIPYGKTTTYGNIAKEIAKRTGKETMSAQAVGGAVGHNPISIIIPCHRVVGSDGSLTGYAGGIEKKIKLLKHEGVDMSGLYVPKKGTAL